jgi:hypothetical protein
MTDQLLDAYLSALVLDRKKIKTVLFVSDNYGYSEAEGSFYSQFVGFRNNFYDLLAKHGLINAYPYVIGGSGCANLSLAIQLGQSLLVSEDEHVLTLFVDKFDEDEKRIMPLLKTNRMAAGTIGSDVSAAFLISLAPLGRKSLQVNQQLQVAQLSMITAYQKMSEDGIQAAYMLETVKGLVKMKRLAQDQFPQPLNAYTSIFTGNYTENYFKIYARQFDWKSPLPDMSTKTSLGHVQSLDSLVSIFNQDTAIEQGLIFLIGPCMWSAIDFTYTLNVNNV